MRILWQNVHRPTRQRMASKGDMNMNTDDSGTAGHCETPSAVPDGYVVVSIASNGIVHAWGDDRSKPYINRGLAKSRVKELRRNHQELYPNVLSGRFVVCKILGTPPSGSTP